MRIDRIEADGFLSFNGFHLDALSPGLTVIVGPNGAGKTNLIRLLQMVRDALGMDRDALWHDAFHLGSDTAFTVKVALEWTTAWERRLLTEFFLASMAQTVIDAASQYGWQPAERIERRLQWLDDARRSDIEAELRGIFQGILEVTCTARPRPEWKIAYRFDNAEASYEWLLDAKGQFTGIELLAPTQPRRPSQPPLQHIVSTMSPQNADQILTELGAKKITWAEIIPSGQQTMLGLRLGPPDGVPTIAERLAGELGEEVEPSPDQMFTGLRLFFHLFEHGIAFTENMRMPPGEDRVTADLAWRPESLNISNGGDLPLYLFLLRNGSREQRERYRQLQMDFQHLTGRCFDIRFEAAQDKETGDKIDASLDSVALRLTTNVHGGEVSLRHAGAGLWEVLILCTLRDRASEGIVLALDEPAANVHPSLQRRILRLLRERRGQSVVITHSPYLIPIQDEDDLRRIIRFYATQGVTRVARLVDTASAGALNIFKVLKEMRRATDVPALLFARGVILVEGETESGALPVWFAKSQTAQEYGPPDDHNLVVHSVGGARNLANYANLLQAFTVPWAVVCDRDQLENPHFCAQFQLVVLPAEGTCNLAANPATSQGVFILPNDCEHKKFEDLPYVKEHLSRAAEQAGGSKARQGRYIAEETPCPDAVDQLYDALLRYFGLTNQA